MTSSQLTQHAGAESPRQGLPLGSKSSAFELEPVSERLTEVKSPWGSKAAVERCFCWAVARLGGGQGGRADGAGDEGDECGLHCVGARCFV